MFTILKAVSVSALTAYLLFSILIGNWFSNLCRRYSLLQSYHLCLVLVYLIALRSDLLISQIVPLLLWEGSRSCPSLACLSTRTCWRALGDHIQFFKASLSCSFFSLFWHVVSVIPIIPGISWSFLNFFLCCCVLQLFSSFCIYCPCPASVQSRLLFLPVSFFPVSSWYLQKFTNVEPFSCQGLPQMCLTRFIWRAAIVYHFLALSFSNRYCRDWNLLDKMK